MPDWAETNVDFLSYSRPTAARTGGGAGAVGEGAVGEGVVGEGVVGEGRSSAHEVPPDERSPRRDDGLISPDDDLISRDDDLLIRRDGELISPDEKTFPGREWARDSEQADPFFSRGGFGESAAQERGRARRV